MTGREGDVYTAVPRRPISASVFHGAATLSGSITPSPSQAYRMEFRLQDGNLDEAVRDLDEHAEILPGQVSLFANVQGEGKNWDTAKGSGGLAIKNASLYQLPLMLQILKSFSINESDSSYSDITRTEVMQTALADGTPVYYGFRGYTYNGYSMGGTVCALQVGDVVVKFEIELEDQSRNTVPASEQEVQTYAAVVKPAA